MSDSLSLAQWFMTTFRGLEDAHGVFELTGDRDERGKAEGKALTKRGQVTLSLWEKHLAGTQGLGIIPINRQNKCKWGVIDVDQYPFDHAALLRAIKEKSLPLWVFRSKSGGAHVAAVFDGYVDAARMQDWMQNYNLILALGAEEIFPKQRTLETGGVGSWLNMPYFAGKERPLLALDGANQMWEVPIEQVPSILIPQEVPEAKKAPTDGLDLSQSPLGEGAPPCLQRLSLTKFPGAGSRNESLYNIAVLLKKMGKQGGTLTAELSKWNEKFFGKDALDTGEVSNIADSVNKDKAYSYKCHLPPINRVCQRTECSKREYGVKQGAGLPSIISTQKFEAENETIWDIELESTIDAKKTGHVRLTSEQLDNQRIFRAACRDLLDYSPLPMNDAAYIGFTNSITSNDRVVHVDFGENSPTGRFRDLLSRFVSSRISKQDSKTKTVDFSPLLAERPLLDEGENIIYFKLLAFEAFLKRHDFKWKSPQIRAELNTRYGGALARKRYRGMNVDCHCITQIEGLLADEPEALDETPKESVIG